LGEAHHASEIHIFFFHFIEIKNVLIIMDLEHPRCLTTRANSALRPEKFLKNVAKCKKVVF
jgi:hypothetical protein